MGSVANMDTLLQAIKSAALQPEAWADVQKEISKLMGANGSQLASVDHSRNNEFWSRSTTPGLDRVMESVGPMCEPVLYAAANPHWRRFVDYDYIDEAGMDRSEFYRLNAQYDIRYRLGLRLIDHPSISRALVVFWESQHGHPDRPDYEKIDRYSELLRLSAHVSLAMGQDLSAERLLLENLERSRSAALVVDAEGEIKLANQLLDPILIERDGIGVVHRTLTLEDRVGQAKLINLIRKASGAAINNLPQGGGVVSAKRSSGLPAYLVLASPLPRKEQFLGDAKGLVLVVIHDPAKPTQVHRTIFMDGFGMTAAEADVSAWFLQGASLDEIAKRRGVSLHTVRQQLKDILRKTGTHRQAELAALLATLSRY